MSIQNATTADDLQVEGGPLIAAGTALRIVNDVDLTGAEEMMPGLTPCAIQFGNELFVAPREFLTTPEPR